MAEEAGEDLWMSELQPSLLSLGPNLNPYSKALLH